MTKSQKTVYKPKVWNAGSRHAITVYDEDGKNVGSYFLGTQKFNANNELKPRDLSAAILEFIEPKAMDDLEKRLEYANGIQVLKDTALEASPVVQAGSPQKSSAPEYRVSGWEVGNLGGYALTIWRIKTQTNIGTYFVNQQRFGKGNELNDQEFCLLLMELVKPETFTKVGVKYNCLAGIDAIKRVAAGGPKPMPVLIRENEPASRLDNARIPGRGLEMARETEISTAAILKREQNKGLLIALHSVMVFPLFKSFGSIDHVIIMNHSVWLVNSVRSERRILPSTQRKGMEKLEKLAPLLEAHINKIIAPANPISVKVALSIWTDADYNKVSPYALRAQNLVRSLIGFDRESTSRPIDRELVARTIATKSTWAISPESENKDGIKK